MDHDYLISLLDFNPETGEFRWKVRRGKAAIGSLAGTINVRHKYRYISIDYKLYRAARLAWFYHYKSWPSQDIDHINRNRDDNAIANLREVSRSVNLKNTKIRKDNTTGYKGVHLQKNGRYHVYSNFKGKRKNLGYFATLQEAVDCINMNEEEFKSFLEKLEN